MKIFNLQEIKQKINIATDLQELINSQKSAFIDFSSGLYLVPPPMQFLFPLYGSDCHIKAAYRQGSNNIVVKIVNGSPFGGNGVVLVFASNTGKLKLILHDEGFLTTLRTAVTGIIASEFAPWQPQNIGIIGSGNLSSMLYYLVGMKYPSSNIMLYARDKRKVQGITEAICDSAEELVIKCDTIFTATSSTRPIIHTIQEDSNKLIIALGSDDEYKSEISLNIFGQSDVVIVDSKLQATQFGDVAKALKHGVISSNSLIELGEALKVGIAEKAKTIIADLSGIGAQDAAMAQFLLSRTLC
ncbi:ornithine cyclodeaminase [Candidatus Odyssella thessalonicensis]|uniref:ornithine cyclodeaminase n=1 Tax=Candidatus Odyssella thessalonicensis TaxID=84647 RepID=UPI000225B920|nr:ornithine cyclodeaminase [Candidatus Odyssella thessalonicensis]